jgi:hypothetical protein
MPLTLAYGKPASPLPLEYPGPRRLALEIESSGLGDQVVEQPLELVEYRRVVGISQRQT